MRSPGSKPFHLRVRFHAFAGEELLTPGEKTQFITGDGTYDETWLEPHHWRREVTLADYHAVEAETLCLLNPSILNRALVRATHREERDKE